MITQLRPFHTLEERARLYRRTYKHHTWPDHIERIAATATLLDTFADNVNATTLADLSCGDGAIVGRSERTWERIYTSDLVPTIGMWRSGPIEETLLELPRVDMFVCSETLEHVEDPAGVLRSIRQRADSLVLTTPDGERDDRNQEHYWGWDQGDLEQLLHETGWHGTCSSFTPVYPGSWYTFQMWTVS